MKKLLLGTAASVLAGSAAFAGGLDRSQQGTSYIFEEPGTGHFTIASVNPNITGTDVAGSGDYDIGNSFVQMRAEAIIAGPNDALTFGFQYDQPYGGDVLYGGDPTTAALAGTKADFGSESLNFLARYKVNDRVSVFGGVRAQKSGGEVALNGAAYTPAFVTGAVRAGTPDAVRQGIAAGLSLPQAAVDAAVSDELVLGVVDGDAASVTAATNIAIGALMGQGADLATATAGATQLIAGVQATYATALSDANAGFANAGGYNVDIDDHWGFGYTVGAAYEIPDIALRAMITYHSGVEHSATATETFGGTVMGTADVDFDTPQSVNLDFQTGVAANTLVTAGIRWAEWGDFDVVPATLGSDLADLDDSWRYSLGVAQRINDALALSASVSYESASNDDNVSPLAPTDGETGLNIGFRYQMDGTTLSGGIGHTWVGDADAGVGGVDVANFASNSITTVGLRIGFEF